MHPRPQRRPQRVTRGFDGWLAQQRFRVRRFLDRQGACPEFVITVESRGWHTHALGAKKHGR